VLAYAAFQVSPEVMAFFILQSARQYLLAGAAAGTVGGKRARSA
jgi:hypothetical protein